MTAPAKYQLFTLYQIRNKRMNWRTLLTLLSLHSPAFSWFYDFGWFTGSALGGVIYYALGSLKGARATSLKPTV